MGGADVMKHALATVDGKKDPWFLYIGMIDTHVSWRGHEPWLAKYDPGYTGKYAKEISGTDVEKIAGGHPRHHRSREAARHRDLRDSDVSYQDDLAASSSPSSTPGHCRRQHGHRHRVITATSSGKTVVSVTAPACASRSPTPLAIIYPPLIPPGLVEEGTDTPSTSSTRGRRSARSSAGRACARGPTACARPARARRARAPIRSGAGGRAVRRARDGGRPSRGAAGHSSSSSSSSYSTGS